MVMQNSLDESQKKEIFIENLSGISWWFENNALTGFYSTHANPTNLKENLVSIGVSPADIRVLLHEEELEGTNIYQDGVVIDNIINMLSVCGYNNLQRLAVAGLKFPGSQFYKG